MEATTELTPEVQRLIPGSLAVGRRGLARQLIADRTALVGLVIVVAMVSLALAAPLLAPYDPAAQDVANRLQSPSSAHLLGTDHLGRDELSRVLYGARVALFIGLCAVLVTAIVGGLLGLLAGFFGGWPGQALMRLCDVQLSFPFIDRKSVV